MDVVLLVLFDDYKVTLNIYTTLFFSSLKLFHSRLPPLPYTRHDSLQPWREEFSDVENGLRMRKKFGKN